MCKTWSATAVLALFWIAFPLVAGEEPAEGSPPVAFDQYWMVFLERGDDPPELDDEAAARLQRQHLGHLGKVYREGYSLVAGPFEVPAEEPLRGLVLYRGDLDREEVEELASADPAVRAGRLKVRVLRGWTGAGALRFEPAPDSE